MSTADQPKMVTEGSFSLTTTNRDQALRLIQLLDEKLKLAKAPLLSQNDVIAKVGIRTELLIGADLVFKDMQITSFSPSSFKDDDPGPYKVTVQFKN